MTDDRLGAFQTRFARGLLEGDTTECEADFGTGYAIHARNVQASLQAALAQAFQVVEQLVGGAFFAQAVRAFIESSPPKCGWLSAYGADFPDFLAAYQPASSLPYLGDLARLEWARIVATFGDTVSGLDLRSLAALPPAKLMECCPRLQPCATLIRSAYPIYAIWIAHLDPMPGQFLRAVSLHNNPEDLLITKASSGEASVKRLRPCDAAFLSALEQEISFGGAWSIALEQDSQFDLAGVLVELASDQALVV